MKGIILSLCDRTGAWSDPYARAGYDVRKFDIINGDDVRLLTYIDEPVRGVLAAPPCTHLSRAGAGYWAVKGEAALLDGLAVVDACLRAVAIYRPVFWALENPPGRLRNYLGPPKLSFQPYEFGDPWTKQTYLWGHFCPPTPLFCAAAVAVAPVLGDVTTHKFGGGDPRRSTTPAGFARAFFQANP